MTWDERNERPTWMARHSLVYSSTTVRRRTGLPSLVRRATKSYAHTWFRRCGLSLTQEPSVTQSRPRLGCLAGTLSPSPARSAPPACGSLSIPPPAAWQSPAGTHTGRTGWLAEPPPLLGPPRRQPLFQRTSVLTGVALEPGKHAAQRCHTCPVPTPRISAGEPGSEVSPCCLL